MSQNLRRIAQELLQAKIDGAQDKVKDLSHQGMMAVMTLRTEPVIAPALAQGAVQPSPELLQANTEVQQRRIQAAMLRTQREHVERSRPSTSSADTVLSDAEFSRLAPDVVDPNASPHERNLARHSYELNQRLTLGKHKGEQRKALKRIQSRHSKGCLKQADVEKRLKRLHQHHATFAKYLPLNPSLDTQLARDVVAKLSAPLFVLWNRLHCHEVVNGKECLQLSVVSVDEGVTVMESSQQVGEVHPNVVSVAAQRSPTEAVVSTYLFAWSTRLRVVLVRGASPGDSQRLHQWSSAAGDEGQSYPNLTSRYVAQSLRDRGGDAVAVAEGRGGKEGGATATTAAEVMTNDTGMAHTYRPYRWAQALAGVEWETGVAVEVSAEGGGTVEWLLEHMLQE